METKITKKEYNNAIKTIILYEKQKSTHKKECSYKDKKCPFETFSCFECPYLKQYIHISSNVLNKLKL